MVAARGIKRMTNPSEVTISDAEVEAFITAHKREVAKRPSGPLPPYVPIDPDGPARMAREEVRQALAAFLAARVPGAKDEDDAENSREECRIAGHNACRDAVLKGGV